MPTGFLNLNKPAGLTSHDCVAQVRRIFDLKRVGHGGTLDPMATGVLPIALGPATRLLPYLPTLKAYEGVIRLGLVTDTDDITGTPLTQTNVSQLNLEQITQALHSFQPGYAQIPPAYSAIQIAGKRLYHLARQGETPEIPPRWVDIFALQILDWQPGPPADLTVAITCGPGTYIRALARDLGSVLGVGGTLARLIRTKSCGFDLSQSINFSDLAPETTILIPPHQALTHLPALTLDPERARGWCCGQKLSRDIVEVEADMSYRVLDQQGKLLGLGQLQDDLFCPQVVLSPIS